MSWNNFHSLRMRQRSFKCLTIWLAHGVIFKNESHLWNFRCKFGTFIDVISCDVRVFNSCSIYLVTTTCTTKQFQYFKYMCDQGSFFLSHPLFCFFLNDVSMVVIMIHVLYMYSIYKHCLFQHLITNRHLFNLICKY